MRVNDWHCRERSAMDPYKTTGELELELRQIAAYQHDLVDQLDRISDKHRYSREQLEQQLAHSGQRFAEIALRLEHFHGLGLAALVALSPVVCMARPKRGVYVRRRPLPRTR